MESVILKGQKTKLLYVVTEDWYFLSHRLPIALAAQDHNYEVHVACRMQNHQEQIEKLGFICHPLNWSRTEQGFHSLIKNNRELKKKIKQIKPDLIHYVAMKPIILGSLFAGKLKKIPKIYAFTGLGTLFTSQSFKHKIMRFIVKRFLKSGLNKPNSYYLFQNADDQRMIEKTGLIPYHKSHVIKGAGIDEKEFKIFPLPPLEAAGLKFAYVGRMLKDKGLTQIIKAHQDLWKRGHQSQLWLVGNPDPGNVTSHTLAEVQTWAKLPGIIWLGHKEDVREIWKHCHVALLMSKREGLPKSLLEAASCGRPIIASDVPGCREVVMSNENGYLVPFGSSAALASAMQNMIEGKDDLNAMAKRSREIIENGLTADQIAEKTVMLYDAALNIETSKSVAA